MSKDINIERKHRLDGTDEFLPTASQMATFAAAATYPLSLSFGEFRRPRPESSSSGDFSLPSYSSSDPLLPPLSSSSVPRLPSSLTSTTCKSSDEHQPACSLAVQSSPLATISDADSASRTFHLCISTDALSPSLAGNRLREGTAGLRPKWRRNEIFRVDDKKPYALIMLGYSLPGADLNDVNKRSDVISRFFTCEGEKWHLLLYNEVVMTYVPTTEGQGR
ncbi:hypothetical protein LXL04_001987 [Taraxacum kok-saghyz]